ncbi:MAG: VWA domain-containing protein [Chthoniobacterales bacterium]
MSFGAPIWFWALAILPVFVLLYLKNERRSAALLREFVSPRLLPQLAGNIDRVRRALRFGFVLLALALAIIALAKPRWGYTYEDVKRRGLDLLIAVDTSRSMLSNDVAPNRLARVKLAAQDLITELNGDRVGLIAFAGRAFLQAPLTIDYDAAVESINDLDTKTIPEGGSNISEAIRLAASTFGKSAMGNRALIIFTDGEELNGDAVQEAKKAAQAGVKIFTVGVGTPQGSLIPVENGFVKDPKGQVVKSKLDENRLREIANATGGMYLHLESGPQTMRQLYGEGLSKLQAAEIDARLSQRPIERYEWPLGAAIIALIGSLFINDRKRIRQRAVMPRPATPTDFASRASVTAAAALLLVSGNLLASAPGIDAYEQGKYDEALKQFESTLAEHPQSHAADRLQFDAGAAAYKREEYDKALQAFSQALLSRDTQLQSKSHYNLGNTLYKRGDKKTGDDQKLADWTGALRHYEETMKLDPKDRQAKENYEFVKKKIDDLKKKKEQPTPTPTPSPPQNKQQQKQDKQQDQQKGNDKSDQQKHQDQQQEQDQQQQQQNNQQQQQKQDGQNQQQQNSQGNQRDQQNKNEQPTPTPSPSAGENREEKKPQNAGESPTPSPSGEGASPSPSPGENGAKPSPSAGDDKQGEGENSPTPTPNSSPGKALSGEIKGANEPSNEQQKQELAAAEAEAEKSGEMSPQQAERLLQAMKDEEARVQLDERRPVHQVYKDW